MHRNAALGLALALSALASIAHAQAALIVTGSDTVLIESGLERARRPGVWVPTSRGLVELRIGSVPMPLYDCEIEPAPRLGRTADVATLTAIEADGTQTALFDTSLDLGRDHESFARIEAVVGSYVFAVDDRWDDNCGAHGNSERSFVLFDLETRASIDVATDTRVRHWATGLVSAARDAFRAAETWDTEDQTPELVAFFPRLDERTLPHVDAVFVEFTCYACPDASGGSVAAWASYYSAAYVDAAPPVFLLDALRDTAAARRSYRGPMIGASAIAPNDVQRVRDALTIE